MVLIAIKQQLIYSPKYKQTKFEVTLRLRLPETDLADNINNNNIKYIKFI